MDAEVEPMTFGSLFAGIGGIDLGLERAGMRCVWQVEIDSYCQKVLTKHWPDMQRFFDVKKYPPPREVPIRRKKFGKRRRIREARYQNTENSWYVDLICGGFPCNDISRAGRREGLDGEHSGLWTEMYRIAMQLRPRYILVENTTSLLVRGMDAVLADLAKGGYDAEWDCLPACAFGAPHIRDRLYLLAYPRERRHRTPQETVFAGWTLSQLHAGWTREPGVGRVAHGVPSGVDRRRVLGATQVPQVAEWLGRRIIEASRS